MKKVLVFLAALFIINGSFASIALINPPIKATEIYFLAGKTGKLISLLDLSQITIKDFENRTGEKMKFLSKVQFKIAQRQLRNSINPDGAINKNKAERFITKLVDAPKGFHLGGFLLGFFLGGWIIGLIIPYLLHDANRQRRINWSWAGFGAAVLIVLILILTGAFSFSIILI